MRLLPERQSCAAAAEERHQLAAVAAARIRPGRSSDLYRTGLGRPGRAARRLPPSRNARSAGLPSRSRSCPGPVHLDPGAGAQTQVTAACGLLASG